MHRLLPLAVQHVILQAVGVWRFELHTIIVTNPSTDVATVRRKWDELTDGRFSRRTREQF